MNILPITDLCLLRPAVMLEEIDQLCLEAKNHLCRAVCVPPLFVRRAKENLAGTTVITATVVGFPYGYSAIEAKLAETILAIVDGADEIELVVNTCAIKNADWQYLAKEINTILPVVRGKARLFTVIIESGLLTDEEIKTCCDIYGLAGVEKIKTATGCNTETESLKTLKLYRKHLATPVKIIAGGRVGNYAFAKCLLDAGADIVSAEMNPEILYQPAY